MYMSAYPAEILVQHGLTDPQVHFLAKPFTHDDLMAKVAIATDHREGGARVTAGAHGPAQYSIDFNAGPAMPTVHDLHAGSSSGTRTIR